MSKIDTMVSEHQKELDFSGPFYISFDEFGSAPCGRIDYPALSNAFAQWLYDRGITPEIVGWSSKGGFCDADKEGYANKFTVTQGEYAAVLKSMEDTIWEEFCKEKIWDEVQAGAMNIALNVLDKSTQRNTEWYDATKPARDYLKNTAKAH